MIDAQVVAFFQHHHDSRNQIVDEAKASCLFAASLNLNFQRAGGL